MAGARASFQMNLKPFKDALAGASVVLAQRQRMAESIGEMLVSSTQQRFEDQRGPDGSSWQPSLRTQAEGGQILVDSARLRNSIGYEASPDLILVGSNVEYAAIHQYGGKAGRNLATEVPARPFLGITPEDMAEARRIMLDFIAGAFL